MSVILGIDPGKKGALAVLDTATRRVMCHDMPDTTLGLHDLVSELPHIALALVEKPFYPPQIGIRSVAVIAQAYGTLLGALSWRSIPVREVRPVDWKQALGLSRDKAASREKAGLFFPDDAEQWKRAKDDGRAEAALIAWYGLRWA